MRAAISIMALVTVCGCGDESPPEEPLFPSDYASSYQEVRDCRRSGGAHEVNHVRVLAAPEALGPYQERDRPFPAGAVLLKEEYEFSDDSCSGPVVRWAVMQKLPDGDSPQALDWQWQQVDGSGEVDSSAELSRCIGCHQSCGVPPDGYDGTCTVP